MQSEVIRKDLRNVRADGIVVFYPEPAAKFPLGHGLPGKFQKVVDAAIERGNFYGKKDDFLSLPVEGDIPRLFLLGLGKADSVEFNTLLNASYRLADHAGERGIEEIVLWPEIPGLSGMRAVEDLMVALHVASFKLQELKSEEKKGRLSLLKIPSLEDEEKTRRLGERARIKAEAVNWVRELGDLPANLLTPSRLAEYACQEAKSLDLRVRIYGEAHLQALDMGSFLGVARGSNEEGKFIVVEYTPHGEAPRFVLVGKAITFDSGGISIKPSLGMEGMKYDMLGGATALSVVFAAARLGLSSPLAAVVPATENLPSGKALKPGDVLVAMNGTSIEIISTDAEGRLILADALLYAVKRYRPKAIVDLATLTGACVVALGKKVAGLFSNDGKLAQEILLSSKNAGEKVWKLPLFEPYLKDLRSEVADIKNSAGREAGAVTAALFLSKFVGDTPWAHLDIAGTAARSKKEDAIPPGATGFGVRLLLDLLERGSAL